MITFVKKDALEVKEEKVIIAHVVNDRGGWGKGFVLSISEKWSTPEQIYRNSKKLKLGDVQFVPVENNVTVANMVAQKGYKNIYNPVPLCYASLESCLTKLDDFAKLIKADIQIPFKMGAGLAGGDWNKILEIIKKVVSVNVVVCQKL